MNNLKNEKMSPYFEDPGLNILTQEKFWKCYCTQYRNIVL